MLTDIEIAQKAEMKPIGEIARQLDVTEDELELYGKYKAKITSECAERLKDKPDGKLILVTAINPTPAGEGKTTTTIGLGMALSKIGKKAVIALREPSLGPVSDLKAERQEADILRCSRWKISTSTSRETSTPLQPRTTSSAQ